MVFIHLLTMAMVMAMATVFTILITVLVDMVGITILIIAWPTIKMHQHQLAIPVAATYLLIGTTTTIMRHPMHNQAEITVIPLAI